MKETGPKNLNNRPVESRPTGKRPDDRSVPKYKRQATQHFGNYTRRVCQQIIIAKLIARCDKAAPTSRNRHQHLSRCPLVPIHSHHASSLPSSLDALTQQLRLHHNPLVDRTAQHQKSRGLANNMPHSRPGVFTTVDEEGTRHDKDSGNQNMAWDPLKQRLQGGNDTPSTTVAHRGTDMVFT